MIAGVLGVRTEIGPDKNCETTKIKSEQSFVVGPGIPHEFITYDHPVVVEEIAYVEYDPSDIHRIRLGGDTK